MYQNARVQGTSAGPIREALTFSRDFHRLFNGLFGLELCRSDRVDLISDEVSNSDLTEPDIALKAPPTSILAPACDASVFAISLLN